MDRIAVPCWEPVQAKSAMDRVVYPWLKEMLLAGHRMLVTVKPATRSEEQSAKFHAMCGDFAKSRIPWAGKPRNAVQWKLLLVSGHAVATKEETEFVPGLEGEFLNIRESTAAMSVRRTSSLIEYTLAMGADLGVTWSEPKGVA